MRTLVTGGAGYIGSHTVLQLIEAGHEVVIADNFSNSRRSVLPRLEELAGQPIPVVEVDLCDVEATDRLVAEGGFDSVIHFAGLKAVGESVEQPIRYYDNNIGSTLSLLKAMDRHGVRRIVFSSSATVYGATPTLPCTEDAPTSATNPYGWTKQMIEQILRDTAVADDSWRIGILRYFNPVGAHPSGLIGEDPAGIPNNLLPYIAQVAVGRRERLAVFGDDYDTPDGTGVRDYIHVDDLAAGHLAALEHLGASDTPVDVWNLGTGQGTSVLELVHSFERACGHEIPYAVAPRRAGDIGSVFAAVDKAHAELGWRATRSVDEGTASTWKWQSQNPTGFPED
ncbi:MAG: UDP-glucose 4-epimerase GalE [Micrococcales bacterium]|nr:UDP-glucose 4-epimerase GalE [Micrococcales bacterium]